MADELTVPDDTSGYLQGEHLAAFIAQDMRGKCGSCKWFRCDESPSWDDEQIDAKRKLYGDAPIKMIDCVSWDNWCHRFPPTTTFIDDELETTFPFVRWHYWCGEWQAKDDSATHSNLPIVGTLIRDLSLSSRSRKACNMFLRDKIGDRDGWLYTAEELCHFSASDLLEERNIGKITVKEIEEKLNGIGLHLADESLRRRRRTP